MFSVEERPESVVLNVIGALDHSVAEALERVLNAGKSNEGKSVVLSFDRCTHVDAVVASVIARWRKTLGKRLAVTGARVPSVLMDMLVDEESVDFDRLLFCDRCRHGITFHGIVGCRFSRCRCTTSHSRLISEALQSNESGAEGEPPEPGGTRILHRYSTRVSRQD
ncbi:MAG: STAS domain-containing protein [Candidatus Baltobacteraceae bacterium]|jgi:hypothetical protein